MKSLWTILVLVFLALCAYPAAAAPIPNIIGEWSGSRPPNDTTRPSEQKWVLTFRKDESFTLVIIEGMTAVPGCEGSYRVSGSSIEFQLPNHPVVAGTYSIQAKDLQISLSDLTTQLGWGKGVDTFVRTKDESELIVQKKQTLLQDGRYRFTVNIAGDNDEGVLKATFGEQYAESLARPIDGGTFPLNNLQGRNIIQLPSSRFGPPEFSGSTFKVYGSVAPRVNGEFLGEVVSSTMIRGAYKSKSTSLHGTFTLERIESRE